MLYITVVLPPGTRRAEPQRDERANSINAWVNIKPDSLSVQRGIRREARRMLTARHLRETDPARQITAGLAGLAGLCVSDDLLVLQAI